MSSTPSLSAFTWWLWLPAVVGAFLTTNFLFASADIDPLQDPSGWAVSTLRIWVILTLTNTYAQLAALFARWLRPKVAALFTPASPE